MKYIRRTVLFLLIVAVFGALLLSGVCAKEYHMTILAVSENNGTFRGNPVDLYLEIEPGSGRVFLDTFPLTKLDTQISTRFAKEMACKYTKEDCDRYDFFYTIRSDSTIVGGPSASGAVTAITVAALKNYEINQSVSMTGTINSGGLIGHVEGVKAKIDAAYKAGITTILIPETNVVYKEKDNTTINLTDYGQSLGIKVINVSQISEVVQYLTGKPQVKKHYPVVISKKYTLIMQGIAHDLCNESHLALLEGIGQETNDTRTLLEEIGNLSRKSQQAFEQEEYYTSASYCFSANIKKRFFNYRALNLSPESVMAEASRLSQDVHQTDTKIDAGERKTIMDLQAYIIVKERLLETEDYLSLIPKQFKENNTSEALYSLSYAQERFYTTGLWSRFLNQGDDKLSINEQTLRRSCSRKISEAEERFQYLRLFLPLPFANLRKDLQQAYQYYDNEEYELCLFKATKVKAQANLIINSLSLDTDQFKSLLPAKSAVAHDAIGEQIEEGIFPIMGYSYYEYAQSLGEEDAYSAMLYLEYALEMSNFDIYFSRPKPWFSFRIDPQGVIGFVIGLLIGGGVIWDWTHRKKKKMQTKKWIVLREKKRK